MRAASDTIAAIATPPGGAERGLVRVSGPLAADLVRRCTGLEAARELAERTWRRIAFADGAGVQPGWLAWMPGPRSLTGEDVAEFHLPGQPDLLAAALARLLELGARAAGRGEFTRRAFLAGKIDLARAEGVLVLVAAENEAERRAGSALLHGGLSGVVDRVRETLADLRALCEASLDFDPADTGHVPLTDLLDLGRAARAELAVAERTELARPGEIGLARVVLAGRPNAGKSQLFNALTGSTALVSPVAGTTRDPLSARMVLGGEVVLLDTAGLGAGEVRAAGVGSAAETRARAAHGTADLLLWVADAAATEPGAPVPPEWTSAGPTAGARLPVVLAWNKQDLPRAAPAPSAAWIEACAGWVGTSGRDGRGLPGLRGILERTLAGRPAGIGRELAARHAAGLAAAGRELDRGLAALAGAAPLDLAAEHLRAASRALDDLTGTTTSEEVLDRIFARFCLGK